jgi:hypothetical protein
VTANFLVRYQWDDDGVIRSGHTVVTERSQAQAEAYLKKKFKHITIVHDDHKHGRSEDREEGSGQAGETHPA